MVFFNINRDTFFVYKIVMRITGVWPLDRDKSASTIVFSLFFTLEVANIITQVIDPFGNTLAHETKDGHWFTRTSWFFVAMMMKLSLRVNGSRMISLIESTIDDWSSITDPEERKIMKRHDKHGYLVFVPGIVLAHLSIVPFIRSLVFSNEFTWGTAMKILSKTINVVDRLTTIIGETLFWSFAFHLSGQFKILKNQFEEHLLIDNKKERRRVFRRLVDRHNELHDLSGDLDNSLGFFASLHVASTQILICFIATELGYAIKEMEIVRIISLLKNLVLYLVTLSVYYYAGDCLTASSSEIDEVFTECNWYNLSKDSIKNFSIVVAQTGMPKVLTFWKFHEFNLSNLKYTLQASYSYISLIVAIKTE